MTVAGFSTRRFRHEWIGTAKGNRQAGVVIQELRQDLDGAMRLRQVWKDRLAECAPSYFEVDAAHWDDLSLAGSTPIRVA